MLWPKVQLALRWLLVPIAVATSLGIMLMGIALSVPIGGGLEHLLFAHGEGGNLGGQLYLAIALFAVSTVALAAVRRMQDRLGWFLRSLPITAVALRILLAPLAAPRAGPAFHRQGYVLAVALMFAIPAWSYWRELRARERRAIRSRAAA